MLKLRVFPRLTGGPLGVGILVDAVEIPRTAFVGRTGVVVEGAAGMSSTSWEPTGEVVELPLVAETHPQFSEFLSHYRDEVKSGALWPADKATADACGVAFDATRGGEAKRAAKESV